MSYTANEKAEQHDALAPLLAAMFKEFQDATKKKPDGVLSVNKVRIVNRLLKEVLAILDGESTHQFLDLLNEDELPQNSDVALILSQAVAAMKSFNEKYYGFDGMQHRWMVEKIDAGRKRKKEN